MKKSILQANTKLNKLCHTKSTFAIIFRPRLNAKFIKTYSINISSLHLTIYLPNHLYTHFPSVPTQPPLPNPANATPLALHSPSTVYRSPWSRLDSAFEPSYRKRIRSRRSLEARSRRNPGRWQRSAVQSKSRSGSANCSGFLSINYDLSRLIQF